MALLKREGEASLRPDAPGTAPQVFEASSGPAMLPSGRFASDAAYLQQGDDLVMIAPDGTTVVVRGYFLLDNPPDLITPEGGVITAALVRAFTPPQAAGQYAQVGTQLAQAEAIGQVKDLTGQAFAVRTDGTRVQLASGDPVFQGDVIETGAGGAINLLFTDETTFALGGDARLALDEMVYNPATQSGSSSFSILKGVFVFVSGQIAQTDNTQMTVTTPVATIGIRGTKVAGEIKPAGEDSKFTVIDGEIAVTTQGGSVVMGSQNATTTVTSFNAPPSAPVILSQSQVNQSYSEVRSISGGLSGGQNNGGDNPEPGPSDPADGPAQPGGEATGEGNAAAPSEQDSAAAESEGEGEGEGAAEGEGVAEAEGAAGEGEGASGEGEEVANLGEPRAPDGSPEGPEGPVNSEAPVDGEGGGEGNAGEPGDPREEAEGEGGADGDPREGPGGEARAGGDPRVGPGNEARADADGNPREGPGGNALSGAESGFRQDGPAGGDTFAGPVFNPGGFGGPGGDNFFGPAGGSFDLVAGGDIFGPVGGDFLGFGGGDFFGPVADFLGNGFLGDNFFPPLQNNNNPILEIISEETLDSPVIDDRSDETIAQSFVGGNNADTLIGGSGGDDILGLAGNDTIIGNAGDDTLVGGGGNDDVAGGAGADILVAGFGLGDDSYDGGSGTDTLTFISTQFGVTVDTRDGTASGFEIDTDSFSNIEVFLGGSGDDIFFGGGGSFSFDGGGGVDRLDYDGDSAGVVVDLGAGTATGNGIGTDIFTNIQIAAGGAGADQLTGDAGDNVLIGGGGADTLDGGAGDDTILAGLGDDLIVGGAGANRYDGGGGIDKLSFLSFGEAVVVDLSAGTVSNLTGAVSVSDSLTDIESVEGSALDDTLIGGGNDDILDGGAGNDTVLAGAGDDTIGFEGTAEFIDGGTGTDKLTLFGASQAVNASNLANTSSIEEINLGGTGANTLTVASASTLVQDVSGTGTLSVFGNGDDAVLSSGNLTLTGPFTLGTVTFDRFSAGAATLDTAVATLTNSGSIDFASGAAFTNTLINQGSLTTSDGTFTNNGFITLTAGGDIDTTGSKTLAGTGTFVNQQSLSLQDDTLAATLDGSSGTIDLAGTVTIDGRLILGAGTDVGGSGTATLLGAGTLENQGTQIIDAGGAIAVETLINRGSLTFTTQATTITSGTITNTSGATADFAVDTTIDLAPGETLTNNGVVRVSSSKLTFQDGLIANGGTIDVVAATSTLAVGNGTLSLLSGAALAGAGTIALASSDLDIAGGVGFTLGNGEGGPTIEITDGNITGAGTLVNESEIVIDGATAISLATFTNASGGTLDHDGGTLAVSSASFENQSGGLVVVRGDSGVSAIDFANDFTNAGVIRFTGGPNSGSISVASGTGTLTNAATGTIQVLDGDNTLAATLLNPSGGVIEVNASGAGLARLTHEVAFANAGLIRLTAGAGASQTAIFNQGSGFTLTNTGTISLQGGVATDVLELSGDLDNQGLFSVNTPAEARLVPVTGVNGTMSNSGTVDVAAGSALEIGISGASGNTSFANTGSLIVDGALTLSQNTLTHTGVLQIGSGGAVKVEANSILNFDTDFTLLTGRTISVGDGTTTPSLGGTGTLTNQGLVLLNNGTLSGNTVNDGGAYSLQGGSNLQSGTLTLNTDTTFSFAASTDVLGNSGLIDVSGSFILTVDTGTLNNLAGGVIDLASGGTIALANSGVFQDDGTTNFGLSPGTLTIVGDMLRGDSSFMLIELGGLAPGIHDGFDQLTVTGQLAAGGTLSVVEYDGFDVSAGDSFAVLNAGTLTGSFREIAGLDVGNGVILDAVQSATGIDLVGRAVTNQGTGGDDTLTGTAAAEVFSGAGGDDRIAGGGGGDLLFGGDGDDLFVAADTGFGRLDGGGGTDTVRFEGAGANFDLTGLRGDQLSNIERLDITGGGDNTLVLDTDIVFAATGGTNPLTGAEDSLLIDGDAGDTVSAKGGWTNTGTVTIDGNGYSIYASDTNTAEIFIDSEIAVILV